MSDDCALVKAPFQEADYPVSEALPRVGEAFVEPVTAFLATADMDRKRCRLAQDFAGAMIRLRGRIARGARVQGLPIIHGTMSHRPLMPKTCTTGLPIGRGRSDRCRPAQYRYYRAPEVCPVAHPGAYLVPTWCRKVSGLKGNKSKYHCLAGGDLARSLALLLR
jgi:hypothetical protein